MRSSLEKEFTEYSQDSLHRWGRIQTECNKKKNMDTDHSDIMIQFAYPRLDINVSKGLNHLLKSPFCVHPKTGDMPGATTYIRLCVLIVGRVCVPIDIDKVEDFNPFEVPTIRFVVWQQPIETSNLHAKICINLVYYAVKWTSFTKLIVKMRWAKQAV